jgi:hypothetical protein
MYRCVCECGGIIFVRGNALSSGNTKSCGCLSKEIKHSKKLPDNKGVINHIILQYKRHAKDRKLFWGLGFDEVSRLIQEPCFYCGAEKSNNKITKNCKGFLYNGLDRKNNIIGYEPGNVVSCCKTCNYAKSNMPLNEFKEWAIRLGKQAMADQWSTL